ncbi:hypothetical protein BHM03_00037704 [Ensete ventricosum]|nr:hypothetical protein BHM03_00037704 [Ensete ventricosum]
MRRADWGPRYDMRGGDRGLHRWRRGPLRLLPSRVVQRGQAQVQVARAVRGRGRHRFAPFRLRDRREAVGGGKGAEGAAVEDGVDGGLAEVPVAGPEQPDGAANGVDGPPARLEEQRLEQGCSQSIVRTGALVIGDGGDEGHEAGAAEELGDEDGGVALRLGRVDPLEARPQHARLAAPLAQHPATVAAHLLLPPQFANLIHHPPSLIDVLLLLAKEEQEMEEHSEEEKGR